jgi:lipopolysaccharide exporter
MTQVNHKRNLIRGAAWTVGTRWVIKGLGFINTIIMARLLMPEDYGIVAMAMLMVGLIQTFLDFGAATALLRKNEVSQAEIDSAWTLRVIQGLVAGCLLLVLMPVAIAYFKEPRLNLVLTVFAACVVFAGASNIGTVLALKKFNFRLDFKIQATSKVASVVVTVLAGYFLRDYRALMLGIVAGYMAPLALSYIWHPYRPHWNTTKIGEIWAITKWLMIANIGNYILSRGDQLVAGRVSTTHDFGLYNVGADLGQLPVSEVGPAMLRAILPVLSAMQEDMERTRNAVIKTLSAINTVIWPIGIGYIALAPQATELLLGSKWLEAIPYVAVFALVSTLQTTAAPARSFLILRGHTRDQSVVVWIDFTCFVLSALALVPTYHLIGLAYARVIGSVANMSATLISAKRKCGLPLRAALVGISRPVLGACIMGLLVKYVVDLAGGHIIGIVAGIICGAASFSIWSLVTWQLMGRPEGFESTVFDKYSEIKLRRGVKNAAL